MKKRIIFIFHLFLILALSGLLSSGCEKPEQSAVEGKVVLTFWHSLVSSSVPALEELLQDFEAKHPGIRIKAQYIPSGNAFLQKLITAVQSNTAPDIAWVYAGCFGDLAQANAIYPLARFMTGENGLSEDVVTDIFPALLPLGSWRGTLYGLPMEASNISLVYNRGMFRRAGLNPDHPPETWEELSEYAQKLTLDKDQDGRNERIGFLLPVYPASGPLGGFMVWQWLPFLWQAGGFVVDEAQSEALFADSSGHFGKPFSIHRICGNSRRITVWPSPPG